MTIETTARELARLALEGSPEEFISLAIILNQAVREANRVLSDEERLAIQDAGVACFVKEAASGCLRAVDALCAIREPMNAAALLTGLCADPVFKDVKALKTRLEQVQSSLRLANSFEQYAGYFGAGKPVDEPLGPKHQAALDEARRIIRSLPEHYTTHELMAVGAGEGRVEEALLAEFPKLRVTFVDVRPAPARLHERVTAFAPKDYYDLPKQDGGFDLVVCHSLSRQPNPRAYVAFLQEQCQRGVYLLTESLPYYPIEQGDTIEEFHAVTVAGTEKLFSDLGLPVKIRRVAEGGHIIATSEPE